MTFWVTLDRPVHYRGADRKMMCVDALDKADALNQMNDAFPDRTVHSIETLPYPGEPRFDYKAGACPSFCLHPAKCAGRSSCPRNIACSE